MRVLVDPEEQQIEQRRGGLSELGRELASERRRARRRSARAGPAQREGGEHRGRGPQIRAGEPHARPGFEATVAERVAHFVVGDRAGHVPRALDVEADLFVHGPRLLRRNGAEGPGVAWPEDDVELESSLA